MIKRALFSITALLFATNIFAGNSISDTSYIDGLTAFDWSPISDAEKILQYENQKDINKRTIDQIIVEKTSNILFIAVGTPSKFNGKANMKYVYSVAKNIGEIIENQSTIIIKSTVPVGTTDKVKKIISDQLKKRKTNL